MNNRMPGQKQFTIGFSSHRPEILPLAHKVMERHEAIVLEEPQNPGFDPMLRGELSIDDYLIQSDFEFPEFARLSCELHRRLYQQGKQLIQCEPYLAQLNAIREIFDNGGKPEDIDPESELARVYGCERRCTAALLAYYENCLRAPFAEVVELLKRFAREDAARNRLRDRLRAQAIDALSPAFKRLYIEAGTLHLNLLNQLRNLLTTDTHLTPLYLTAPVVQRICGRRHALGPGDKLTLCYIYREGFTGQRADLLAAQTLIHSKIQLKDEQMGAESEFPHTRDEIESAALVTGLSYGDCRTLYDKIKGKSTIAARATVRSYLDDLNVLNVLNRRTL